MPLKAILLDLDDTLYDHLLSARTGLAALATKFPRLESVPFSELENRYSKALEHFHLLLMNGSMNQREVRVARMQQLFGSFDIELGQERAYERYTEFRAGYDSVCRLVPGALELLAELKQGNWQLACVTNNLVAEQLPKLDRLGIHHFFDQIVISEEVGVSKPDRKIFDVTSDRLSVSLGDCLMIGDSLTSDIAGANSVGIPCIWLDRYPQKSRTPPTGVHVIQNDLQDLKSIMDIVNSYAVKSV